MVCPRCGSPNIQVINQQVVTGKVVDNRKTKGKYKDNRQYSNQILYCCMNCGNQFR